MFQIKVEKRNKKMGHRIKFRCVIMLIAILLSSISGNFVYGKEIASQKQELELMFVLDASGSMRSNDRNKMALDMMSAFIDTIHTEHIKIGFVAYSDKIVSSVSPISIENNTERKKIKKQISDTDYSGNTDIGLGLLKAYENVEQDSKNKRVLVLISDGETDLGQVSKEQEEEAKQRQEQVVLTCEKEEIPIYTVAFGDYDGNQKVLEKIAKQTKASSYVAKSPETLIDVLYGIFDQNVSYKIQEITNSTYANGEQEISYRNLSPVLQIETEGKKKNKIPFEIYFEQQDGTRISDEEFYKKFEWKINPYFVDKKITKEETMETTTNKDGIAGTIAFSESGTYKLKGTLFDSLGSYEFQTKIQVENSSPTGALPQDTYTIFNKKITYDLPKYFQDENNDVLTFSLGDGGSGEVANVILEGETLTISPKKSGKQRIQLFVSDGTNALSYMYEIQVVPLRRAYWWLIGLIGIVILIVLWKIFYKPKPEIEKIAEKKVSNRFQGKLDAYFTIQPEEEQEIPPLTFPMYRIKSNRVRLADLLEDYKEAVDTLDLENIYLIADEERRMILYHSSKSSIMISNSIVCRLTQYSVGFGDIIYITAPDETYELELHYIAMLQ
ncbi:MAG TPA: hypothetical protein DIT54_08910 [Lachnospiraceae bacterium]|nr:hypothetical protein [Lachnospiraceae bacterium]